MVQHQEAVDLVLVQQFFTARGLIARRVPEGTTKTTDFEILRGAEPVAVCEMKSPQDVFPERVTAAILQAPPGRYGGVIETARQYRCLERAARKAVDQFNSANPSHAIPNILIIVNHDTCSDESDFVEAVTGYMKGLGYASQSLRANIPEIDAYVWLNSKAPDKPRILWQQNGFRDTVIDLLQPN